VNVSGAGEDPPLEVVSAAGWEEPTLITCVGSGLADEELDRPIRIPTPIASSSTPIPASSVVGPEADPDLEGVFWSAGAIACEPAVAGCIESTLLR
jgi:hypothetical protein